MSKARKAILDALGAAHGHPEHCGTLSQRTGYRMQTVRRIVDQLITEGIVTDNGSDGVSWYQLVRFQ